MIDWLNREYLRYYNHVVVVDDDDVVVVVVVVVDIGYNAANAT